jgi:Tfp pilus assembly protein PilV
MRDVTRTDGFSLVESLIACGLLASALVSIGHLSSGAIVLLADARNRTLATMLAVAKVEELRASAAPAAGVDTVDSHGQPAANGTFRQFDRRWSVSFVSTEASILTVVVTPLPRGVAGREVRIAGGWVPVRR